MGVAAGELIVPFTGAIQAAFSVLLTIAFGVVAAQCNLLSPKAAKEVSKLCVRMFLPALLIYKIGSNLHQDTGVRYVPVLSKFNPTIQLTESKLTRICSMVNIIYFAFCLRRSPPHAHLQVTSLGRTSHRFQQHNFASTSSHPVAQTNPNTRCYPHWWRVWQPGYGSCRVILSGECYGQQLADVCYWTWSAKAGR